MKCKVCNTDFYPMSYDPPEPEETCWCGQMMRQGDSLWEWNGWRGYRDFIRYRLATFLMNAETWICQHILRVI